MSIKHFNPHLLTKDRKRNKRSLEKSYLYSPTKLMQALPPAPCAWASGVFHFTLDWWLFSFGIRKGSALKMLSLIALERSKNDG